ncbi:MAG: hypothetical protein EA424_21890 [Planctomycetaceae bacterium]|nr:MAG: hypothetical protein EA424_21890 [Planctomycetaceae bacterium]
MKYPFVFVVLAGAAMLAFVTSPVRAQSDFPEDDLRGEAAEILPFDAGPSILPSDCDACEPAVVYGRRFHGGRMLGARYSMAAMAHSGQPLVDPWMRADWIAQQRSANRSWHAGYYHTETGAPLALMVPPTVRSQTRWSWGVAQSSVSPLYHQFKRPYPGPAMGHAYGDSSGSLLPTPRWPSHTDQFGVYYIRGPW